MEKFEEFILKPRRKDMCMLNQSGDIMYYKYSDMRTPVKEKATPLGHTTTTNNKKSTREDINLRYLRCTCWINRVVLHFMFAEYIKNCLQKHVAYVAFICLELEKLEQRVSYQY